MLKKKKRCKEIKIPLSFETAESLNIISEKCNDVVLELKDKENHKLPFTEKQIITFFDRKKDSFVSVFTKQKKNGGKFLIMDGKYNEDNIVETKGEKSPTHSVSIEGYKNFFIRFINSFFVKYYILEDMERK